MAARQVNIPGVGYTNLAGDGKEFLIPGSVYVNDETTAAPGGFKAAWVISKSKIVGGTHVS